MSVPIKGIAVYPTIRPHNEKAAATWSSGGAAYEKVSETIADALQHVVDRLNPRPGEKCLDVATGTGWTARLVKSRGADVVGVDIGAGVIEAAKTLATDHSREMEPGDLAQRSAVARVRSGIIDDDIISLRLRRKIPVNRSGFDPPVSLRVGFEPS